MKLMVADYKLDKINEISELVENCFATHGTCYLLLSSDPAHVKTFKTVAQRLNAKKNMRIYLMDLTEQMGLFGETTVPPIIALNGGKGWYKKFEGDFLEKDVMEWMDAVKMGEGKKVQINQDIMQLFGMKEKSSKDQTTSSTESVAEGTPLGEGVKEVFGDDKESFHDEL